MDINLTRHATSPGTGTIPMYICIAANVAFLLSAFITFFASTVTGDPFAHFDSQPKWMFMSFCSFAVAVFQIAGSRSISARFNHIAGSDAEPGHEHKRYSQLQATFTLSAILGFVAAVGTGFLASLWGGAASEVGSFRVPCIIGWIAVVVDVLAIFADGARLVQERAAFLRATGTEPELGNGDITI